MLSLVWPANIGRLSSNCICESNVFKTYGESTVPEYPDPARHQHGRGIIESILRIIPGFRGYLEKEYRRESDYLARKWIADRLQTSKRGLDDCMQQLVSAGEIDLLPEFERLRSRLDRVISRVRGEVRGYSAFFEFAKVNEELLDDVYDYDASLMSDADKLGERLEKLADSGEPRASDVREYLDVVDDLERRFEQRGEMLNGLGPQ